MVGLAVVLELSITDLCVVGGFLLMNQRMVGLAVVAVVVPKNPYAAADGALVNKFAVCCV